jgi:class 3 adenylate cyclase
MKKDYARKHYEILCRKLKRKALDIQGVEEPDGSWRFVEQDVPGNGGVYEGAIVRGKDRAFVFRGALGKVFRATPQLGLPTSNEQVLGATAFGRYQSFDHGVAIWDGGSTFGFPLVESLTPLRRQLCMVAFFDMRGFTTWAAKETPENVAAGIQIFERAIHSGFPTDGQPWLRLAIKGTGDGVMIVSQADWYKDDGRDSQMAEFKRKHANAFLTGCRTAIADGWKRLRKAEFPLGIGCGIATGQLDRVFLFGRLDYIGPAANEAAKLQQHAWDEILITDEFKKLLKRDNQSLKGAMELKGKGWRLLSGWSQSSLER